MAMLTKIELAGFKSIKQLSLPLSRMNVLIGANGAGKSNFIQFFRLLRAMLQGELQLYVGKVGGAFSLLHDGPTVTQQIEARITLESGNEHFDYRFALRHAADAALIFVEETCHRERHGQWLEERGFRPTDIRTTGYREALLPEWAEPPAHSAAGIIEPLLRQCSVYQFHNTSETSRIRQRWPVDDNIALKEDAANLAPFLLRLQTEAPRVYRRIVGHIQQVVPFFAEFILAPSDGAVSLRWRERGSDVIFGPSQTSDGMLRTMSLIALLLQPLESVPAVLIIDEPELGLHPYAVEGIAGMLQSLAIHKQVILATQSPFFLNEFALEDVIVVDRHGRDSAFRHLNSEALQDWMEEYSLGELWEKNVLGGRPT